jgi:hypothetical protein
MIQEKLVWDFMMKQTEGWIEEDVPLLEQEFLDSKKHIIDSLSDSIRKLCLEAKQQQAASRKGLAAYLCISFLRTNILDEHWQYRLDLYDEKFYLDRSECTVDWDSDFIWKYLKARLSQLNTVVHTGMYANKVRERHIEQVKVVMAEQYHKMGMICTKRIIEDAIKVPEYRELPKVENFQIVMGEYRDQNMLIYEEQPPEQKE